MPKTLAPLKAITVRIPEDDLALLEQEAHALGVSVGVMLRILVRQGLRGRPHVKARQQAEALLDSSPAMAQEAAERGLSERDVLEMSRDARKHVARSKPEANR